MNIAFFAVAISVLLGFAGLATDTGMIWITRTRLQNSVDAAALAGAQELPATTARSVACTYASVENAVPGMIGKDGNDSCAEADIAVSGNPQDTIKVTAYRTVQPVFGRILGFEDVEVSAQATARIGSLGAACLFPFFLPYERLTSNANFFFGAKFLESGRFIDVGTNTDAAEAMIDCTTDPPPEVIGEGVGGQVDIVDEDDVPIHPGVVNDKKIRDAWDKIESDALAEGSLCKSPEVSSILVEGPPGKYALKSGVDFVSCPRLIMVPVLTEISHKKGKLEGFIPFYFADVCDTKIAGTCQFGTGDKEPWGYVVRLDVQGDFSTYRPEFGTKIVSLTG